MTSYPGATQILRETGDRLRESGSLSVITEMIHTSEKVTVVRAEIQKADGTRVSAHASASTVEQAEDAAIFRAITLLGISPAPAIDSTPTPSPPPRAVATAPATARPPAPAASARSAPAPVDAAEPALEDFSWTAFWRWARERGVTDKTAVEKRIGQPIGNMTPAELRAVLAKSLSS